MDGRVNYPKDFESSYNYDGSIDYTQEVEEWNKAIRGGIRQHRGS